MPRFLFVSSGCFYKAEAWEDSCAKNFAIDDFAVEQSADLLCDGHSLLIQGPVCPAPAGELLLRFLGQFWLASFDQLIFNLIGKACIVGKSAKNGAAKLLQELGHCVSVNLRMR